MLIGVVPAADGWKLAVSDESPPLNVTGLLMVPTTGVAGGMTTVTLNGPTPGVNVPPPAYASVPGVRIAGSSVTFVGFDRVVVVNVGWLGLKTKPVGITVTVLVPLV